MKKCTRKSAQHRGGFMGFGSLNSALSASVRAQDAAIGFAAGLAGAGLAKYLVKGPLKGVPAFVKDYAPVFGGAAAGAALFYAKKGSPTAKAQALCALAGGASVTVWDKMKKQFPALADFVQVEDFNGYGVMVEEGSAPPQLNAYNALVEEEAAMNDLAAISMSPDED